jgi:hypothetical protein
LKIILLPANTSLARAIAKPFQIGRGGRQRHFNISTLGVVFEVGKIDAWEMKTISKRRFVWMTKARMVSAFLTFTFETNLPG